MLSMLVDIQKILISAQISLLLKLDIGAVIY